MIYQYQCEQCGKHFLNNANPSDPTKPHPSFFRKKNPSFHLCVDCQNERAKEWKRQYDHNRGQQSRRQRKELFRNGIELAKYEWKELVEYYDGEPAPNHVMWDFFPARKLANNTIVPAVSLIGTVRENDLVTRDSQGKWITPRASRQLKYEMKKYEQSTQRKKRKQTQNYSDDK